jgi:hypothetical protein
MLAKHTSMKLDVNKQSGALPRYVRPPTRGQEYFSRFSRSKLYQLERDGEIRGISLHKEPGQKQGIKLFDLQSIFDYIERQAASNQIREKTMNSA